MLKYNYRLERAHTTITYRRIYWLELPKPGLIWTKFGIIVGVCRITLKFAGNRHGFHQMAENVFLGRGKNTA